MDTFEHKACLIQEILNHFPPNLEGNSWMLDATFGAGGHTKAVLNKYPFFSIIGLDRDLSAIEWSEKNVKPQFPEASLHLFHQNFHQYSHLMEQCFPQYLEGEGFDIILVDLGVSSPQLDQEARGFSFYKDGPLDMRMDQTQELLASEIVNHWSKKDLMDLFYHYGEILKPLNVVQALLKQREWGPIETTKELADLIVKKQGWKKKGFHPATPYFLALRLKVNNELEGLKETLPKMIKSLKVGGRLFILTFHSLEARIVKNFFKTIDKKQGRNLTKKVIQVSREEIKKNPRARSAQLRIFEKGIV